MSRSAEKVSLDIVQECSVRGCGCFTDKGYYVHCRKGSADALLFVCERCFKRLYRDTWLQKLARGSQKALEAVWTEELSAVICMIEFWVFRNHSFFQSLKEIPMIDRIMENGFIALAAYIYLFALVSLGLFVLAVVANVFLRNEKFDIAEIRRLFVTNLVFVMAFALLDHFLI